MAVKHKFRVPLSADDRISVFQFLVMPSFLRVLRQHLAASSWGTVMAQERPTFLADGKYIAHDAEKKHFWAICVSEGLHVQKDGAKPTQLT